MKSNIKAIFTKEFNYTARKANAGWKVKPSEKPQTFPRELIEAAIAAGCAHEVPKENVKDNNNDQP